MAAAAGAAAGGGGLGVGCNPFGKEDEETCFASLSLDEVKAVAEHFAAVEGNKEAARWKELALMQNGAYRTRECFPPLHSIDSGGFDPDDGDGNWARLEPFFFDEAAAVADHKRQVRRQMRREKAAAHMKSLLEKRRKTLNRIREYDPKTGLTFDTRFYIDDLDLDEESPLGPMRETGTLIDVHGTVCREVRKQFLPGDSSASILGSDDCGQRFIPCDSANVLSVKIASSDVGFPIDVYGTVIARDSIDYKCIYLFRRDRYHSQLILSKDESLMLTGPKRGLALLCSIHFEFDLKIKGAKRSKDKQLSKGYLTLDGVPLSYEDKMVVERDYLETRLSTVVITYAAVHRAIEATFAIEVLQGKFYGDISACTTSIRDSIVLYDSKYSEDNGRGVIQLLRPVVAVDLKEKLKMTIAAWAGDGKAKSIAIVKFAPGVNGGEEKQITCGSVKMCAKVTWSIISREYI